MTDLTDDALKQRLLHVRPGISGPELSLGDLARDMVFNRSDWVSAWEDRRHVVWTNDLAFSATRAITRQGRLIWMVRSPGVRRPYHARASTAAAAIQEASLARQRRAEFRHHKEEVRRIVRELRFLRVRHDVTVEDAYASPLCEEGVDGFLRALRLPRFRRFPGWLIAWLQIFDRQVEFVLFEARKRHLSSAGDIPASPGHQRPRTNR